MQYAPGLPIRIVRTLLAVSPDMGDKLKRMIPMGRFGEAEELREAIMLAGPLKIPNSLLEQTITLDGGTSL